MTKQNNIAADLQKLLKRASASKAEQVKKAEEISTALDGANNHTVTPTSGAQTAGTMAEAKATETAAAVDVGAKTNVVGGSVTNSTDGAAASAVNGQTGAKAPGEMGASTSVANKDVMNDPGTNSTTGAFKSANAEAIRAIARDLHKQAEAMLSPMDKFLVKSARNSANAQIKKAAEGMDDQELANASAGSIDEQLQGGQIDDATAAQILQEALAEGAITQEELQAAAAELQGQGDGDADDAAGANAGAAPADSTATDAGTAAAGDMNIDPAAAAAAMGGAPATPEAGAEDQAMAADPLAAQKIATAHIDEQHPDYVQKLAALYPSALQRGYDLFQTVASDLLKQAAAAKPEVKVASDLPTGLTANTEEEKKALATAAQELGLTPDALSSLVAAPAPAMDKTAAYRALLLTKIAAINPA